MKAYTLESSHERNFVGYNRPIHEINAWFKHNKAETAPLNPKE